MHDYIEVLGMIEARNISDRVLVLQILWVSSIYDIVRDQHQTRINGLDETPTDHVYHPYS